MALDAGCLLLPAGACAALSATCLAPLCLPAHTLPPSLWLLVELAAVAPVICCVFWSPAAAFGALGVAHFTEWDEEDGKFVGVEEDTIVFSADGEATYGDVYGDVYCPMTAEDEAAVQAEQDATMHRRISLSAEFRAESEGREPPPVSVLSLAANACAGATGCPAGCADAPGAAAPPEARLKGD